MGDAVVGQSVHLLDMVKAIIGDALGVFQSQQAGSIYATMSSVARGLDDVVAALGRKMEADRQRVAGDSTQHVGRQDTPELVQQDIKRSVDQLRVRRGQSAVESRALRASMESGVSESVMASRRAIEVAIAAAAEAHSARTTASIAAAAARSSTGATGSTSAASDDSYTVQRDIIRINTATKEYVNTEEAEAIFQGGLGHG